MNDESEMFLVILTYGSLLDVTVALVLNMGHVHFHHACCDLTCTLASCILRVISHVDLHHAYCELEQ